MHIPEGIRFECSFCGNCCLQWPVPCTQQDVLRIQQWQDLEPAPKFKRLSQGDSRLRGFSHTLEKQADGRCQFLTKDERCQLQNEHGPEAKPAMCRLFPYSFCQTPDGIYVYVSFASSAVLYNQGKLLSEQKDLLAEKFQLHQELFPQVEPDWTKLQILDGYPLKYSDYSQLEIRLIEILLRKDNTNTLQRLLAVSQAISDALPSAAKADLMPVLPASPGIVDQLILKHLNKSYLPFDHFSQQKIDLDYQALGQDIVQAPDTVTLSDTAISELKKQSLGQDLGPIDELLTRFVYSRIFAKLYFAHALGHLSLLSGVHHLFFIVSLIQLRLKQKRAMVGKADLSDAAELLRQVERRLTQMNYSPASSATLEVLLSSPQRLDRVFELAN